MRLEAELTQAAVGGSEQLQCFGAQEWWEEPVASPR